MSAPSHRAPRPACAFCRIVLGTAPAVVVREDELTVAFRDSAPVAPVHVLVVPRAHIPHFGALAAADSPTLAAMVAAAQQVAARERLVEHGYRVVANVGEHAGASVDHLHLHVLGGRRLTWPPG